MYSRCLHRLRRQEQCRMDTKLRNGKQWNIYLVGIIATIATKRLMSYSTSDAECYRNTYPGGYYQFGCGKSDWATSVETMYSGQPSDMFLQVVYTGVVFSPLPAKASTTSSVSTSSTSASTSSQTSSSSSSSITSSSMSASSDSSSQSSSSGTSTVAKASGASSTTATSSTAASFKKKENAGAIVGAVIGGLLGLALIIGFALWCGHRRRNQKGQERAGSFITQHNKGVPPTSGPFQRMRPYGPDDFSGVTPRNGNSVEVTANPNAYASLPSRGTTPPPAQPPVHPGSKPGTFQQQYFATPPTASTPLVSEIDGFAQGYNAAITQDRDTHIHTGDLPSAVSDPSPMLMRGGSGGSDRTRRRSQDWSVTTEALRAQRPSSTTVPVQPAGWIPRALSMRGASTGEGSPEFGVPPRSPLREAIAASLSAAVAGKRGDDVQRYQLVDEVLGDDVPILHSPGRLRRGRARSGTVDKE